MHPRSTAILLALLGALAFPSFASADAVAPTTCKHAEASPADAKPKQLERAIRCLVGEARQRQKAGKVRPHKALRRLARKHTRRMIAKKCLRHRCPGEPKLADRLERSGYLRPGQRYGYGEAIGYAPTPLAMIQTWLDGPLRKSILGKRYTHVGIGVAKGAPRKGLSKRRYATYTLIFAWRRG
jgi:uncharacterized protein YkwD